jgi:D-threo-aldose 1-dehydrogenase
MTTSTGRSIDGHDPAERRALGASSAVVTRLGLGCAPLGNLYEPISDRDSVGVVDAALAAGIRFFDTAPLYGSGLSEERLGAAVAAAGTARTELVLATKVGRLLVAGLDEHTIFKDVPARRPVFDYSERGVLQSVEESLTRLGVDRIDVVHVHDPDDHIEEALASAFPALRKLRDQGVVAAIGAGMNQSAALTRFVREASVDCVLIAGRYSLLDQSAAADLLPAARAHGVSVIVGGVFNSGVLANPSAGHYDYAPASADVVDRVRRLAQCCQRYGVPLTAAALQFPLGHPAVTSVIVGARSAAEVERNAADFRVAIPSELWDDFEREGLVRSS